MATVPAGDWREEEWTRDVGLMVVGWLLGTLLAILLLMTVVRGLFV